MKTPWLRSARFDLAWILGPPFVATAAAWIWVQSGGAEPHLTPLTWLLLIVGVDVAHVYGALFRSYLNPQAWRDYGFYLRWIPGLAWILGVLLYSLNSLWFWRALAYLALFHFIRQAYGFMALYARRSPEGRLSRLDAAAIYAATLYPVLYWHCHPREFHWFVDGDFFPGLPPSLASAGLGIYMVLLGSYFVQELRNYRKTSGFNLPKNLVLLGTALAWYVGIVLYNADGVFTLTNVVSHGIPYVALVWQMGAKQEAPKVFQKPWSWWRPKYLPLFLGILLILAFAEEGLWDGLVWREHGAIFAGFRELPKLDGHAALSLIVPLLALPQATHYLLDGVLWRMRRAPQAWRDPLLQE